MYYLISWTTADGRRIADQRFTAEHISHKLAELEQSKAENITIVSGPIDCKDNALKLEKHLENLTDTFEEVMNLAWYLKETIYGIAFKSIWARRAYNLGENMDDTDYELYNLYADYSRIRALIANGGAYFGGEEWGKYYADIVPEKELKCYKSKYGEHLLNVFFATEQNMYDAIQDGSFDEADECHNRAKKILEDIEEFEKYNEE